MSNTILPEQGGDAATRQPPGVPDDEKFPPADRLQRHLRHPGAYPRPNRDRLVRRTGFGAGRHGGRVRRVGAIRVLHPPTSHGAAEHRPVPRLHHRHRRHRQKHAGDPGWADRRHDARHRRGGVQRVRLRRRHRPLAPVQGGDHDRLCSPARAPHPAAADRGGAIGGRVAEPPAAGLRAGCARLGDAVGFA